MLGIPPLEELGHLLKKPPKGHSAAQNGAFALMPAPRAQLDKILNKGYGDHHILDLDIDASYGRVCPDRNWKESWDACPSKDPGQVEHAAWDMRRYKWGHCKCTTGNSGSLSTVQKTFCRAYQIIRSAELEIEYWADKGTGARSKLWRGYIDKPTSSLAYWFGREDFHNFEQRFDVVRSTISIWSRRFRKGFYDIDLPVIFCCRPNTYRSYSASHVLPNVISLYKGWFDNSKKDDNQKTVTILHEMGHLSRSGIWWVLPAPPAGPTVSLLNMLTGGPRDRRNSVCPGKCYRQILPVLGDNSTLNGAPRSLVEKFEQIGKHGEAYRDMLDNIDNYVCYLWNRWVDRRNCRLQW